MAAKYPKEKKDPNEPKGFFESKKIRFALLLLTIATIMEWFGHFSDEYSQFLIWFGSSTVLGIASQDVGQSIGKSITKKTGGF